MLAVRHSDLIDCIGLPSIHPRERRTHARIAVSLAGRVMLESGGEFDCRVIDISLGGLRLRTPAPVALDERIVAYLDHFGRVEGRVARVLPDGFALRLAVAAARQRRFGELLMWIGNKDCVGAEEDRRHCRIVPRTAQTVLEFVNRTQMPARIIDMSRSGASIAVDPKPPIGTRIVVGRTTGDVVRHFDSGIAIEFLRPVPEDRFDEQFVL